MKRIFFSLVPVLILYLVSETLLSTFNMSPFVPLPEVTPPVEKSQISPWGDTRIVKERIYLGAPLVYEAPLFRAFLPPATKSRGVKRIVFVGDSYVFGTGIAEYETLPFYLSAYLRYYRPEIPAEMVNLGRPGADTSVYVRMAEPAARYQPDLVVLGFTVANDAEVGITNAAPVAGQANAQETDRDTVWRTLTNLRSVRDSILPHSRTLSALYRPVRRYEARARMDLYLKQTFDDENQWRQVRLNLAAFSNYFREKKIPTVLIVYPYAFATIHIGLNDIKNYPYERYHARVAEAGSSSGFTVVIDCLDYFRKEGIRSFDSYIVDGDGHPNGAFNAFVAKHLVGDLLQRVLP